MFLVVLCVFFFSNLSFFFCFVLQGLQFQFVIYKLFSFSLLLLVCSHVCCYSLTWLLPSCCSLAWLPTCFATPPHGCSSLATPLSGSRLVVPCSYSLFLTCYSFEWLFACCSMFLLFAPHSLFPPGYSMSLLLACCFHFFLKYLQRPLIGVVPMWLFLVCLLLFLAYVSSNGTPPLPPHPHLFLQVVFGGTISK